MSNIIDKIQVSGITYDLPSGGGNATVELTQAEYDALVSGGTVSANTYYIITDAQSPDITQYWTSAQTQSAITQATSGKIDSSSVVSSVTSASTDSEIPTAKAVWDVASQGGGGGKTISGGTNISITTGETADTINCTLPITINNNHSIVIPNNTNNSVRGSYNFVGGRYCNITNYQSGADPEYAFCYGRYNNVYTEAETAFGKFNVSRRDQNVGGTSATTIFTVGNGTSNNARHNAFEIRQNGDMYLNNGTSDVKLQDYLQIKVVKLTQQEYDALATKDNNTLYVIT